MISNCQKVHTTSTPQQQKTKQRQLNTCLLNSIKGNLSSKLATTPSEQSSLESKKASTMSTLTQDLRSAAVAGTAGNNMPNVKPPLDAVVVNSIIYSKPSFCTIAVDLGDLSGGKKSSTNGPCHNSETFCSPAMSFKTTALNFNAASCLAGLAASSSSSSSSLHMNDDAKVYRMCTTINGSIHHQISEFCDNILAMAEFFKETNNKQDDDSFIEFNYGDEANDYICNDNDEDEEDDDEDDDDDDEEDFLDDEEVDYDEDLDDDNDVVDFSYECPIEPAPKLNCDKKKKVRFNTKPTVHVMHTWNYAYRAARKGEWEMYARDRERFKLRIQRAALILNPILEREHRQKIYEKRFVNLYDNDGTVQQDPLIEAVKNNVTAEVKETKEETSTTNIESKKPHQKKKRRKRRFCKMGNKHYF